MANKALYSYQTKRKYDIFEVGLIKPELVPTTYLGTGQVGYIMSNMKTVSDAHIGDTFYTSGNRDEIEPFSGYQPPQCMVYAGIYPFDPSDYDDLQRAIDKLTLTDGAVQFTNEQSGALGSGFRCGFLGMLHMDVFKQRIRDEHNLDVIITNPSVTYKAHMSDGSIVIVENPVDAPPKERIEYWEEAIAEVTIFTPLEYMNSIKSLVNRKRGVPEDEEFIGDDAISMKFKVPLSEMIIDFYDQLKSMSQGYASMEYKINDFQPAPIDIVVFHLNGEPIDALTFLVHTDRARSFSMGYAKKLKELIPSQQFSVAIQAKVGKKVVARETVKAVRKNVTAKCYGGDQSRKNKLLDRQKKGKAQMRMLGSVKVTSATFLGLLKT